MVKERQNIRFSRREAECLVKFLQGRTIRETADDLGVSGRTVEFYVKNMKKKIGCCTKAELVERVSCGDYVLLEEDG